MYNRYIPEDASYTKIEPETPHSAPQYRPRPENVPRRQPGFRLPDFLSGKEGSFHLLGGREGNGLSNLLKAVHLENFDSGDVLLLLILLYLLVEGDDLELVIALGLTLIMGFGEPEET